MGAWNWPSVLRAVPKVTFQQLVHLQQCTICRKVQMHDVVQLNNSSSSRSSSHIAIARGDMHCLPCCQLLHVADIVDTMHPGHSWFTVVAKVANARTPRVVSQSVCDVAAIN